MTSEAVSFFIHRNLTTDATTGVATPSNAFRLDSLVPIRNSRMNKIIGMVKSDCVIKDSSVPSSSDDPPLDKHFLPETTETTKHVARGMFIFFVTFKYVIGEKSCPHVICTIFISSPPPVLFFVFSKERAGNRYTLYNDGEREKDYSCAGWFSDSEKPISLGCTKKP